MKICYWEQGRVPHPHKLGGGGKPFQWGPRQSPVANALLVYKTLNYMHLVDANI